MCRGPPGCRGPPPFAGCSGAKDPGRGCHRRPVRRRRIRPRVGRSQPQARGGRGYRCNGREGLGDRVAALGQLPHRSPGVAVPLGRAHAGVNADHGGDSGCGSRSAGGSTVPAYSVTSTPGHLRGLMAAGSAERSRPSLSTEDGQEYRRRKAELHRLLGLGRGSHTSLSWTCGGSNRRGTKVCSMMAIVPPVYGVTSGRHTADGWPPGCE
jgi:hypothetical protein